MNEELCMAKENNDRAFLQDTTTAEREGFPISISAEWWIFLYK